MKKIFKIRIEKIIKNFEKNWIIKKLNYLKNEKWKIKQNE
jgi:hypothetical protein